MSEEMQASVEESAGEIKAEQETAVGSKSSTTVALAAGEPGETISLTERLEPVDNSAAEEFLRAALGHEPSVPLTREDAKAVIRYYGKHNWTGQRAELGEDVVAAIRDEALASRRFAYIKFKSDWLWRRFEDRLAKPDKEGKHPLHPLFTDGVTLAALLVFIIFVFHFWLRNIPFMQKPL